MNHEAKTWNEAVSDALENLPVEVIQIASDESLLLNFAPVFGLTATILFYIFKAISDVSVMLSNF